MDGTFAGTNAILQADACIVKSDPYVDGWLYAARGVPEPDSLDVHEYIVLLGKIIQKMQDAGYPEGEGEGGES
nr:hypothetical protein [Verrucomicrobium spinosum]